MINNYLNIKFLGDIHHPQLSYSKQVTAQQEILLRPQLTLIVNEVLTQLSNSINYQYFTHVNVTLSADDKMKIFLKFQGKKIQVNTDEFSPHLKKQAEQLLELVKQLNIFQPKATIPLGAEHYVATHFQFIAQQKQPESSSLFSRISQFFQRFLSYYIVLKPFVQEHLENLLKGKTVEKIKQMYVENQQGFKDVKEQLLALNPSLPQLFTSQELDQMIHEQFIQKANECLTKRSQAILDSSELYHLDILRLLHELKTSSSSIQILPTLNKIDPLKIPLQVLAEIPLTSANQESVVSLWRNLIGNFFYKGRLDHLKDHRQTKEMILQTIYAGSYMEALHLMPSEVKQKLADFVQELQQRQTSSTLQDFLIQSFTILHVPMTIDDPLIQHEQEIYQQKIHPILIDFIKEKISSSIDASGLLPYLELQEEAHDKLNELVASIMKKLSSEEKEIFPFERIETLFLNEVERLAVLDYHLLSSQLDNLRQIRQEVQETRQQINQIQATIDIYNKQRTDLIQHFEPILEEKKQAIVDPYLKVPTFKLPLALATFEQFEQAIQLRTLPLTFEQMQELERALQQGDTKKSEKLITGITHLTIKSHSVRMEELAEEYLPVLEENYNELKIQLQTLEKILQENDADLHVKRKKHTIEKKLKEFDQFFDQWAALQKQKTDWAELEQQIQQANKELHQTFRTSYEALLKEKVTLQPLLHFASQENYEEFSHIMWIPLFEHLLNDEQIEKFNRLESMNKSAMDLLTPYVKARAAFKDVEAPEKVKQAILKKYEELEQRLTNPMVKEFLATTEASYHSRDLSEKMFSKTIVHSLSEEKSILFTTQQQTNLMRIQRILAQLKEESKPLTLQDKEDLKQAIKNIEKDSDLKDKLQFFVEGHPTKEKVFNYLPSLLQGLVSHFVEKPPSYSHLKIPAGITLDTFEVLNEYFEHISQLTKDQEKVKLITFHLERLVEKSQTNPSLISDQAPLSLAELGLLSRFVRLAEADKEASFIKGLEQLGLLEVDSDLQELADVVKQAQTSLEKLEKLLRPAIDRHYQDGTLLVYVGKKKQEWLDKPLSFDEQLTMFVADGFTHAAKLYHKDGQLQIGHIYGNLEQDLVSLYQLCISDTWEIDLAPLVAPNMEPVLKDLYGDHWGKVINRRYQTIESQLQIKGETQFENIGNNPERRMAAGLADHPWLFKWLLNKEVKGHEKQYPQDFVKLHQKFFEGDPPDEDQICSEFVSKTTLVSMIQLNKELTQALQEKLGKNLEGSQVLHDLQEKGIEVPKNVQDYLQGVRHQRELAKDTLLAQKQLIELLKQHHYDAQTIHLIIRLGNQEIFDLPYSKKERLKAIHPGRMIKLLRDKQCAKPKAPPEELTRLISFS